VAVIRGCTDCHGDNLAGEPLIEDPALGYLYASNLTAGQGGVDADFTDADFVRAIRHGVGSDGKPLWFMPAQEFYYLNDDDLGALIAYIKSLPPMDNVMPKNSGRLLVRILFVTGQLPLVPAELVDHNAPRPPVVEPGVTVEYGEYLAVGCQGCHHANYAGGPILGAPPDVPPAANLTPAGELAEWAEEDFINTMRFGIAPDGDQLDPD
jgi:mono/diheme cytochrome c family protein